MQYDVDLLVSGKHKSAILRAKLLLRAQLGWLWGYPSAVENQQVVWQQLYYPMPWDTTAFSLTPTHLAQASVVRNRLVSDFPRALPEVLGDVDSWGAAVTLKLQALRALLDGQTLNPIVTLLGDKTRYGEQLQRQASTFCRQFPALRPLAEGFVWWLSMEPDTLAQALRWLASEQYALHQLLERDGDHVRACASLFALSQHIPSHEVSWLLRFVIHPVWVGDALIERQHWLAKLGEMRLLYRYDLLMCLDRLKLFTAEQQEKTLTSHDWCVWADALLLKNRRERRQYVQALQTVFPLNLLDDWLAKKQQSERMFGEIDQTLLSDFVQQQAIFRQQKEALANQSAALLEELRALPASKLAKQQRIQLAEQRNTIFQQLEQLRTLKRYHIQEVEAQLDVWLASADASPAELLTALSYVPHQQNLPVILNFAVEQQVDLQRLQVLLDTLQPQHEWHGADRLLRWVGYWLRREQQLHDPSKRTSLIKKMQVYLGQATNAAQLNQRLMPWGNLLHYPWKKITPHFYDADEFKPGECAPDIEHYHDCVLPALGALCDRRRVDAECDRRRVDAECANALLSFLRVTPQHWPQVDFFSALLEQDIALMDYEEIGGIDGLFAGDYSVDRFLALVKAWGLHETDDALAEQAGREKQTALPAVASLTTAGFGEVVDYFMESGQWQVLGKLQPMLTSIAQMSLSVPPPVLPASSAIDWSDYPDALQPTLLHLQRYHLAPQKVARRILSAHCPQPDALQQEIVVLEQKLAGCWEPAQQQAMAKRLLNLKQRLTATAAISATQLEKLSGKLRHAAYSNLLESWQRHCWQVIQGHVQERLNLPTIPTAWMQDKRHKHSLAALCKLGERERSLASLLLRANLAGEHQDLRYVPKNQEWLGSMERAGINMQPWLQSSPLRVQIETEEATLVLRLQFADDVFDILQMGDHFETCLSHDQFNFFSVVANAADLNKRVVYAYDAAGRVFGRCLLGISAEKRLLSFHSYSHAHHAAFEKALNQFLTMLEQSMGIQRGSTGRIPLLLAGNWYDDGVRTLLPEYAALAPTSVFRKQLEHLPPEQILSSFQQTIAPLSITEEGILQLLALDEIQSCAARLFGIHHQAQQMGLASVVVSDKLVETLLTLGSVPHSHIWSLAKDWIVERLLHGLTDDLRLYSASKMVLLLSQSPVMLLGLVRKAVPLMDKSYGIYQSDIHVYHARALLALHRPHKAEAAYRMAMQRYQGSGGMGMKPE